MTALLERMNPNEAPGSPRWVEAAGVLGLSPQQARILELIALGKADKQIARELEMSFGTLRTHLSRAFAKTGAEGRMELVMKIVGQLTESRQTSAEEPRN